MKPESISKKHDNSTKITVDRNEAESKKILADEEIFEKFYNEHIGIINVLDDWIRINQIAAIFSTIVFLILLIAKLTVKVHISTFILLVPALISIITISISLNAYLRLKDIFDEAENGSSGLTIGSFLSYFSLNLITVAIVIYLIMLSLKIEEKITTQYSIMGISIYICLGILLFYLIFILPAFIQNKFYFLIAVLFVYLIGGFVFFLLINLKLDGNLKANWCHAFIPAFIAIILHWVYATISLFKFSHNLSSNLADFFAIMFGFVAIVVIALILDQKLLIPNWIPISFLLLMFIVFASERIFTLMSSQEEDENKKEII